MTRQRNRLRPEQLAKLERWGRHAVKQMRGVTLGQVANVATKELGFPVTAGNVRGLGLDWGRGPGRVSDKPDLRTMVERLRRDLDRLRMQVSAIRGG